MPSRLHPDSVIEPLVLATSIEVDKYYIDPTETVASVGDYTIYVGVRKTGQADVMLVDDNTKVEVSKPAVLREIDPPAGDQLFTPTPPPSA